MIHAFNESATRTIRRIVRDIASEEFELRDKFRDTHSRQIASWVGQVATKITARSSTTPGTGTATIQSCDTTLADASGVAASLDDVTVYSLLKTQIPVDSYIRVWQDQISGKYWVVESVGTGCRVGKLGATVANNATGSVTIWTQSGTSAPSASADTETGINITGQTLQASVFVKLTDVANFNYPIIEPIELGPC